MELPFSYCRDCGTTHAKGKHSRRRKLPGGVRPLTAVEQAVEEVGRQVATEALEAVQAKKIEGASPAEDAEAELARRRELQAARMRRYRARVRAGKVGK